MEIGLDVVRRLVDEQLAPTRPELHGAELVVVDRGWDNEIVRVGSSYALRLPVRDLAVGLIRNEWRWLAEVASPLSVAAPVPVALGEPTSYYPYPWTLVPWIDGTLVDDVPLADRGHLVDDLADAMLALHRPAPADAPPNPFRGVPLSARDQDLRARILAWPGPSGPLLALFDAGLVAPAWPGPALWLHGDVHPRNMLAGDTGLAALLDFGDLTAGDPASDLATAWWTFGPEDRARFRARLDASGRYDDAVWVRAKAWAAAIATAIAPGTPMEHAAAVAATQLLTDRIW